MSKISSELGKFFAKMIEDLASQPGEKVTTNREVKVAQMTHRRCPIYATLRKSVTLSFKLIVNGVEVSL